MLLLVWIILSSVLISATVYAFLPYATCNQWGSASETHVACNASGGTNEDWTDATEGFPNCEDGALSGNPHAVTDILLTTHPRWSSHQVFHGDEFDPEGPRTHLICAADCPERVPGEPMRTVVDRWVNIPGMGWEYYGGVACNDRIARPFPRGGTAMGAFIYENPVEGTYYVRCQIHNGEAGDTGCLWGDLIPVDEGSECCDSDYADRDDMSYYAHDFGE